MESSDNTTPPRQAAGRPSLLNSGSRGPAETGTTRMLSSLERGERTPTPPAAGSARPRNKYGIVVLALVLLGAAGAVFTFQPFGDASSSIATAAAPRVAAVPPATDAGGALALGSAASSAAAEAVVPAASAKIELAAVSALPGVAEAASAPRADGNPLDKLALNDTETAHAAALAASGAKTAAKPAARAKPRAKPVVAKAPGAAGETKAAAARKAKRSEDDADTELVAAMIDRLDRRGPQPLAPATPVTAPKPSDAAPARLAELVRGCSSKTDLLEARQCRNRVCDKHWGKADACPASRAPKTSSADEALIYEWRG